LILVPMMFIIFGMQPTTDLSKRMRRLGEDVGLVEIADVGVFEDDDVIRILLGKVRPPREL